MLVLKDKQKSLGPGLGLEGGELGPGLGLASQVLGPGLGLVTSPWRHKCQGLPFTP